LLLLLPQLLSLALLQSLLLLLLLLLHAMLDCAQSLMGRPLRRVRNGAYAGQHGASGWHSLAEMLNIHLAFQHRGLGDNDKTDLTVTRIARTLQTYRHIFMIIWFVCKARYSRTFTPAPHTEVTLFELQHCYRHLATLADSVAFVSQALTTQRNLVFQGVGLGAKAVQDGSREATAAVAAATPEAVKQKRIASHEARQRCMTTLQGFTCSKVCKE
jgi:hypothetical protein